jgi:hypothetical protein
MKEKLLELGQGLELWKTSVDELREQDTNARSMSKEMFQRLTETIGRDKRLESLPFCALTEKGIEIVSGHHRVRTARAADVKDVYILLDVTGLTPSQIAAKQLAHNAIAGVDDEQLVREIYAKIGDAASKLEAFVDSSLDVKIPKVEIDHLKVQFTFKTVALTFLPRLKARVDTALEFVKQTIPCYDELYVAAQSDFEPFTDCVRRISKEYEIRIVSDIVAKMAELAQRQMGQPVEDGVRVALRDLLGSTYIPVEAAKVVKQAVDKMEREGNVGPKNRWQVLEMWAADYLAGN